MAAPTLAQRVLTRIVSRLGGVEQAATYLRIEHPTLEAYLEGRRPVPDAVWLKAVDLIMEEVAATLPRRKDPQRRPKDD